MKNVSRNFLWFDRFEHKNLTFFFQFASIKIDLFRVSSVIRNAIMTHFSGACALSRINILCEKNNRRHFFEKKKKMNKINEKRKN